METLEAACAAQRQPQLQKPPWRQHPTGREAHLVVPEVAENGLHLPVAETDEAMVTSADTDAAMGTNAGTVAVRGNTAAVFPVFVNKAEEVDMWWVVRMYWQIAVAVF